MPKIHNRVGADFIINLLIHLFVMKYQKAKMIAKNLPTGSYAAGCPANYRLGQGHPYCMNCERSQ